MPTHRTRWSAARRGAAATGAALLLAPVGAPAFASVPAIVAEPARPSVRVFSGTDETTVYHRPGEQGVARVPILVTAVGGTFDLRIQREDDYAHPYTVEQVVHGSSNRRVPLGLSLRGLGGFGSFFDVVMTGPGGGVVYAARQPFCPNSYEASRIDPRRTDQPTFPEFCGEQLPFTLGTVWGIDDGWAVPALLRNSVRLAHGDGTYHLTVRIRQAYRDALGISDDDATATTTFRLRTGTPDEHNQTQSAGGSATQRRRDPSAVRVDETPPVRALPDLRTVPAFMIETRRRGDRDLLTFGASVWVAGNSLLDIQGFRRSGEDVMDAWQYFHTDGRVVGRAPVGEMEYDTRRGHHHWHFLQFARYRLLARDQRRVTRSRKQSFCIAPTHPVDLSLDGAERRPYATGLASACSGREATSIRELLPMGWGDTYMQERGGQAFDITGVPNGRYYISVEANPAGQLHELDTGNNVSLRKIRLSGRPGYRSVCVPGIFGIDKSGTC